MKQCKVLKPRRNFWDTFFGVLRQTLLKKLLKLELAIFMSLLAKVVLLKTIKLSDLKHTHLKNVLFCIMQSRNSLMEHRNKTKQTKVLFCYIFFNLFLSVKTRNSSECPLIYQAHTWPKVAKYVIFRSEMLRYNERL